MAQIQSKRTIKDVKEPGFNDQSIQVIKQKIKKPPLDRKVPKLDKKLTDLEDHLFHIEVPQDLSLPPDFINRHTDFFIQGVTHILNIDPTLYRVIVFKDFPLFAKDRVVKTNYSDPILTYWYALISSIISQQVSGLAARSIEAKFRLLFEGEPTPHKVLSKTHDELRGAGLSNRKAEYVKVISEHFINPENKLTNLQFYHENTEEEIIDELISLKGIGVWSAKMFLIFTLGKMNVFAHDDLGVARGAARYLMRRKNILDKIKLDTGNSQELTKLLSRKSKFSNSKGKRDWTPYHDVYIQQLGAMFKPYQSIIMLLFWRLASTNIDVLEGITTSGMNDN